MSDAIVQAVVSIISKILLHMNSDIIHDFSNRWTDIELRKTIDMLRRPEFDSKELDPDDSVKKNFTLVLWLKLFLACPQSFRSACED